MTNSESRRPKSAKLVEALNWGVPESPEFSEIERLMSEFQAHELQEQGFVQRYREVAKTSSNSLIKFLLRLVIADEERHQALAHFMAASLKGDLTRVRQEDPIQGLYGLGPHAGELLEVTEEFIRFERDGIREYERLMAASKGHYHGLFAVLCRAMIHDSNKHVEILEFLRDRLRESSAGSEVES